MRGASAVEPALEEVRRRDRVLGRLAAEALRERGREALVGGLDRHGDELPQRGHEQLRLGSLLAVLAAERQRQAHDDLLCFELGHEPGDLGKAALAPCLADDADGAGQRTARVRDGDAGTGGAVVERDNPHSERMDLAIQPASSDSRAGMLPLSAHADGLVDEHASPPASASPFPHHHHGLCIRSSPALPKLTKARFGEQL